MSEALWIKIIEVAPALVWAVFGVVVFLVLRSGLIAQLRRMRSLRTPFGEADFEVNLALLERAADELQGKSPPTAQERRAVVTRLDHAADSLKGGRLLWVDDHPEHNRAVVRLLERVGMSVDIAVSTSEALDLLRRRGHDLIITDMRRGADDRAGLKLLDEISGVASATPVVLFAAAFDPTDGVDPRLFAWTTDVDEVVHLVIDVMERRRFGGVI